LISSYYHQYGVLPPHLRITNGFKDGGRPGSTREIITVDTRCDPDLINLVDELSRKIRRPLKNSCQQHLAVANIIRIAVIKFTHSINIPWRTHIPNLKTSLGSNIIPIGLVRSGCCRHMALLFKYLCDRFGIDCTLQRGFNIDPVSNKGSGHTWTIVHVPGMSYLFDLGMCAIVNITRNPSKLSTYVNYNRHQKFKCKWASRRKWLISESRIIIRTDTDTDPFRKSTRLQAWKTLAKYNDPRHESEE
jgi:hypothetical protein